MPSPTFGLSSRRFLTPVFATPIRAAAECHANLTGYRDRILRRYFEG
jgi:hypothetical protein